MDERALHSAGNASFYTFPTPGFAGEGILPTTPFRRVSAEGARDEIEASGLPAPLGRNTSVLSTEDKDGCSLRSRSSKSSLLGEQQVARSSGQADSLRDGMHGHSPARRVVRGARDADAGEVVIKRIAQLIVFVVVLFAGTLLIDASGDPLSSCSGVPMTSGQADIDTHAQGTTFCLSGTHNWTLWPKTGDTVVGDARKAAATGWRLINLQVHDNGSSTLTGVQNCQFSF
jgi:hypothetical protein